MDAYSPLVSEIVAALRAVVGDNPAPLHAPRFDGNERAYLAECIDSTFVSSVGKFVDRFETELAAFTGARHAVAVVNGTAALHAALLVAGVVPGDEVVVPALTFAATANAVAHCGGIPHFADSTEDTLGLDPTALAAHLADVAEIRDGVCVNRTTGRVIRALVPMHTFGHPMEIASTAELARQWQLVLVEDAAESLGSWVGERHTGTFGRMGTLSFNGNKTITTGGGGAILTDDDDLARRAKHLTTTAKQPHRWAFRHDYVAYNYRLPNINAALGCAQLEQLPHFIAEKRHLFEKYRAAFAGIPGVRLFAEPSDCRSNYWLQTLILDADRADLRDTVLAATNDAGLMTRPAWELMHHLPAFRDCPCAPLPEAESLVRRIINIPSSAILGAGTAE